ncbi:MAG: hypothetical protein ACWGNV_04115 [Bacteroidales bacterium]
MDEAASSVFEPVNDPIKSHSQLFSCVQFPDLYTLLKEGHLNTIQVFYERIAQEIYNARKKNYSWGFGVIEPRFINLCDKMILVSQLYKEEELADLNSVIFKLFTEFNNIIVSTALNMHLPIRGLMSSGQAYEGTLRSRKPALVSGKDPLILSDLLKVYSFGEIFPNGYTDGMIPAVEMPFHFGEALCQTLLEVNQLESIGIFLPAEFARDSITEVTILSNMLTGIYVDGKNLFACNWKEWMKGQADCSPDNIVAFAETEAGKGKGPYAAHWKSLVEYAVHL